MIVVGLSTSISNPSGSLHSGKTTGLRRKSASLTNIQRTQHKTPVNAAQPPTRIRSRMFQSKVHSRDQAPAEHRNWSRRSGRKLHVEVMERRLMLSAAPVQLQQTSFSAELLSGLNFNPSPSIGQISITA